MSKQLLNSIKRYNLGPIFSQPVQSEILHELTPLVHTKCLLDTPFFGHMLFYVPSLVSLALCIIILHVVVTCTVILPPSLFSPAPICMSHVHTVQPHSQTSLAFVAYCKMIL